MGTQTGVISSSGKELTFSSIVIGLIVGCILTSGTVYLGLYVGMTVSASIPAAVVAMAIYRGLLNRKDTIHETNIVQTIVSAGETLAAGIIFTIPALVLLGAWNKFDFWTTTLIAIAGGTMGAIGLVPLRKALIVENKELTYPEGVACATVLNAGYANTGKSTGVLNIAKGFALGGLFKFMSAGLGVFKGSLEAATRIGDRFFFAGTDVSAALLGVGYIVNLHVAMLVFTGGMIGWVIGIPLIGIPESLVGKGAIEASWTLWSTQIRYLGVGAMIVGGIFSIYKVRTGIAQGFKSLGDMTGSKARNAPRMEKNMSLTSISIIFALCLLLMLGLYNHMIGTFKIALIAAIVMFFASFLFVAVSAYICGLVGTSNNPVSGITISVLLGTAVVMLVFGFKGESAILATLGVASVVCCAACTAGDCGQDLKTGQIIKTTPRSQQIAQVLGVVIPAIVIAPTLTVLHETYVIGEGLKAPQATLFASIAEAFFGDGNLPLHMIYYGMIFGVCVILFDELVLKPKKVKYRFHLMPLAIGIYLPVTLAVPIFLGGVIRSVVEARSKGKGGENDSGVLLSSGLIAGEAIFGVLIALVLYFGINLKITGISSGLSDLLSFAAFVGLAYYLYKMAWRDRRQAS